MLGVTEHTIFQSCGCFAEVFCIIFCFCLHCLFSDFSRLDHGLFLRLFVCYGKLCRSDEEEGKKKKNASASSASIYKKGVKVRGRKKHHPGWGRHGTACLVIFEKAICYVCLQLDSSHLDWFAELQHISTIPQSLRSFACFPLHRVHRVTAEQSKCKKSSCNLLQLTWLCVPAVLPWPMLVRPGHVHLFPNTYSNRLCLWSSSISGKSGSLRREKNKGAELLSSHSLCPYLLQPI